MFNQLMKKIFGTRNDRLLKQANKEVERINAFEPTVQQLTDDELKAKTDEFKQRLTGDETLETIMCEAFAVAREACRRVLGMRPFDVQVIGAIALHKGKIAEMKTGEGKTLAATMPAYLNALTGKGVHIITVNDYLAQRDRDWMGPVYEFLGLSAGVNLTDMDTEDKRKAYAADITYGTNNEFGFDYLRDNMAFSLDERVQRELQFAIIDEVDSILIDEARTPLIISGPAEDSSERYKQINDIVPKLVRETETEEGDYTLDEKNKQVNLTERGHEKVEQLFTEYGLIREYSLYDSSNIILMHYLDAALRAHKLYRRDVDYVVKNGQVIIVDEHTGRLMPGRRWSEGLHQAMEAKEGVPIQNENQTLASVTFQNFFRLYEKLSGMTGTADTEAYEFQEIYKLEVMVIPTNKPMIRKDYSDLVYLTQKDKFDAIIEDIKQCRERGQPTLVGTASIENSEHLSDLLQKQRISHQVLNAKHHEQEAAVIAQAGTPGTVTIATNMAGRGTDIVLGGNLDNELEQTNEQDPETVQRIKADWQKRHDQVVEAGGLHIIGTERHESRRIDNQLRGRSGRQGDPGSSRFYLSLEDNLLRIFASDRVSGLMKRLGMNEEVALESRMVTRAIENAQRKVEGHNFDIRKQLLKYDNVADDQRKVIYNQRYKLMAADDISDTIDQLREDVVKQIIDQHIPPQSLEEQWDIESLKNHLREDFHVDLPIQNWLDNEQDLEESALRERIDQAFKHTYRAKEDQVGSEIMRQIEKTIMLQTLDSQWKEHLAAMDHLRESIHLRGYAQKDPTQEYKRESFNMFWTMLYNIKYETLRYLTTLSFEDEQQQIQQYTQTPTMNEDKLQYHHEDLLNELEQETVTQGEQEVAPTQPYVRESPKIGRNESCHCGSGKKYKHCHGKAV